MPALSPAAARRLRLGAIVGAGLVAALVVIALLVLSFGWAYLRQPLERRLSARLGRPVTIGSLRRTDGGFAEATLAIDDIHVGQPAWAGGGDFVGVDHAVVTLPILPILHGGVHPRTVTLDGLRIHLLRRDGDHANWKDLPGGGKGKGDGGPGLQALTIRRGTLVLDDFKRQHFFKATLAADGHALLVQGAGTLIGRPSRIRLLAPPPVGRARWPFRLDYRSAVANIALGGIADKPLDLGHFDATARAWGDDLKHLDLLVEAGLPGTAPVVLDATVRHDRPDWNIKGLTATIGRSHIAGTLAVRRAGERTVLDGNVVATALDFDDLANAEGRARGAAARAAAPNRRLPDTRISLAKLTKLDGKVVIDIRHLLFRKPSAFRSMAGTLALDHGTLTIAPFAAGLVSGTLAGAVVVKQTGATTRLALDLRLRGGRIEKLASDAGAFSGALDGRFLLAGPGTTIRQALGAADGRFAVVGHNGTAGRQVALLLGQDIGRGAFAKADDTARLRCAIASFTVRGGKAHPAPLLIDTDVAQAKGTGTVDLTNERIDLSLTGAPKQKSVLRLSGPIRVTGQLFAPSVAAPQATSSKGIFASLKRAVTGGDALPMAADADCTGLAARALR